jgi:hypothetical protein
MVLSILPTTTLKVVPLPKSYPDLANFSRWYYDHITGDAMIVFNENSKFRVFDAMEMYNFSKKFLEKLHKTKINVANGTEVKAEANYFSEAVLKILKKIEYHDYRIMKKEAKLSSTHATS